MFAVAGALAVDCVRQGHPATVHILVDSLGQFVRKFLVPWLKRRGGWVSFCLSKILGKHEMHKKLTFEIQQRFAFASFVCVCAGVGWGFEFDALLCAWQTCWLCMKLRQLSVVFQQSEIWGCYLLTLASCWMIWWKVSAVKWIILMLDLNNIQTLFYFTLVYVCLCIFRVRQYFYS